MLNQTNEKKRKEERYPVTLPVKVSNAEYVTRDISPSGVYFEADISFNLGDMIEFVVEFKNPSGDLKLKCNGEIIRKESRSGKIGVAVKILESVMESA